MRIWPPRSRIKAKLAWYCDRLVWTLVQSNLTLGPLEPWLHRISVWLHR